LIEIQDSIRTAKAFYDQVSIKLKKLKEKVVSNLNQSQDDIIWFDIYNALNDLKKMVNTDWIQKTKEKIDLMIEDEHSIMDIIDNLDFDY